MIRIPKVTMTMRELDGLRDYCIQGFIDGHPFSSGDQILFDVSGYPAAKALLNAMGDTGRRAEWVERRARMEPGDGLFPDLRTPG